MKKGIILVVFFVFLSGMPCQAAEPSISNHLANNCVNVLLMADMKQEKLQSTNCFDVYMKLFYRLQDNGFIVDDQINEKDFMSKPYILVFMFSGKLIGGDVDKTYVTYHFAKNNKPKQIEKIDYESLDDLLEKVASRIYQWDFISRQMNKCN